MIRRRLFTAFSIVSLLLSRGDGGGVGPERRRPHYYDLSIDWLLDGPTDDAVIRLSGKHVTVSGYAANSLAPSGAFRLVSRYSGDWPWPTARVLYVFRSPTEPLPPEREHVFVSGALSVTTDQKTGNIVLTLRADPEGTGTEPLWLSFIGIGLGAVPYLALGLPIVLGLHIIQSRRQLTAHHARNLRFVRL